VLDRGPGVPEAERARVFEPFWRGGDPRGAGSGLGLAIVAEIAAAHGGRALALDRPGGGAEFRIELPQIALPLPRADQALAAQ
jgi:signal transduction histidine kinase